MLLEDVPAGSTIHFVLGPLGAGKSIFINYLLGHAFVEEWLEHLTVQDTTKPYAEIAHDCEPSQFDAICVFPLNENVYLCELPSDLIGALETKEDMSQFEQSLRDKQFNVKLMLVTSLPNLTNMYGNDLWSNLPKNWNDFIQKHESDIKFIMNGFGDARYKYKHYKKQLTLLLNRFDLWLEEKPYKRTRPKATMEAVVSLLKKMNDDNMFVWPEHSDLTCRERLLPLLMDVKPQNDFIKDSPQAQQLLFFKTKREVKHSNHGSSYGHDVELHQQDEKATICM